MSLAKTCSSTCARLIGDALQRLGPSVLRAAASDKLARKLLRKAEARRLRSQNNVRSDFDDDENDDNHTDDDDGDNKFNKNGESRTDVKTSSERTDSLIQMLLERK